MTSSSSRSAWAFLVLRLAVGLLAILHGLGPLLHARGSVSLANAQHLALALVEVIGGILFILGAGMPLAGVLIWLVVGRSFVHGHGWPHKVSWLGYADDLFRLVTTAASALGGPGKWGIGKD